MKKWILIGLLPCLVTQARAVQMYNLSDPNPPIAFANLDPGVINFDDILIPSNRMLGQPRISINQIVTRIDVAAAGTYGVEAWVAKAKILNGQLQPETPVRVGTISFTLGAPNANQPITWGNGVNEVFALPVLPITYNTLQFGVFFFGLKFDAPLDRIGWNLANGPDSNIDGFYGYYGAGNSQNGVFGLGEYRASFNVKMQGSPVPEPTTWLSMAIGSFAILVIRRRR